MYGEFAVLSNQHRREILNAYAGSSGNDDNIGVRLQCFENGVVFIAYQAGKIDDASIALDESGEHGSVSIHDVKAFRLQAAGQ